MSGLAEHVLADVAATEFALRHLAVAEEHVQTEGVSLDSSTAAAPGLTHTILMSVVL